jgi:hypothetical protein
VLVLRYAPAIAPTCHQDLSGSFDPQALLESEDLIFTGW